MRASGSHSVTFERRRAAGVGAARRLPHRRARARTSSATSPPGSSTRRRRSASPRRRSRGRRGPSASATTPGRACSSPSPRSTCRPSRAAIARAATLIDDHHAANPATTAADDEITALFAEGQAAKTFVNEAATRVVDRALALSGGAGYLNGSPLARAYRDVRAGAFMHPLGANRAYGFLARRRARPAATICADVHVETVIIGAGQAGLALSRQPRRRRPRPCRARARARRRALALGALGLAAAAHAELAQPAAGRAAAARPGRLPRPPRRDRAPRGATPAGAPVREHTTVVRVRRSAPRLPRRHRPRRLARAQRRHRHRRLRRAAHPGGRAAPRRSLHQLHAAGYRRPGPLPDGGVLVVGAGPSGQQIAAELRRAGRDVVLAAGRHARMPRTYRGRDIFAWLHAAGQLDAHADDVPDLAAARRAPSFPVSGAARRRVARPRPPGGPRRRRHRPPRGLRGRRAALRATTCISHSRDAERRLCRVAGADRRAHRARRRRCRAARRPAALALGRRPAPTRPGARRPHGPVGDGLPPRLPVARRAGPRRRRRARASRRRHGRRPACSRSACASSARASRTSSAASGDDAARSPRRSSPTRRARLARAA